MPFRDAVLLLLLGALCLWVLRIAGPLRRFWASRAALVELRDCDLCLGFWVYVGLSFLSRWTLVGWWRPMDELLTGLTLAFLYMILKAGWQTYFQEVVINADHDA